VSALDETPRPEVKSGCFVCGVEEADVRANLVVVSPTGKAHFGNGGDTECGKDATGDKWWWPL
jgi:hypothetical protein